MTTEFEYEFSEHVKGLKEAELTVSVPSAEVYKERWLSSKAECAMLISKIESMKCCDNCMSQDGYDCRTCTRNFDADIGNPLQDHWGLDK